MLVETPDFPPKHPLAEAAHSILQGYLIAEAHLKKRSCHTMQDLELADQLRTSVWTYYFRFAELRHHVRSSFSGFTDPRAEIIGAP
jgi:hypothetical protein